MSNGCQNKNIPLHCVRIILQRTESGQRDRPLKVFSKRKLLRQPREKDTVMNEEKVNRTRVVTLRLTTKEYEKIQAKFQTITCRKLSDYLHYVLLEKKLTVFTRNKSMDDFMAELILLRNELNAIGNNYNQVVKKLHSMQSIPELKLWFFINESAKDKLVKKVDEIKVNHI
jgi:hypothetical protein